MYLKIFYSICVTCNPSDRFNIKMPFQCFTIMNASKNIIQILILSKLEKKIYKMYCEIAYMYVKRAYTIYAMQVYKDKCHIHVIFKYIFFNFLQVGCYDVVANTRRFVARHPSFSVIFFSFVRLSACIRYYIYLSLAHMRIYISLLCFVR